MNGLYHHKTLHSVLYSAIHRGNIRILVPGAGLGRLAYDIAGLGKPHLPNVVLLFSSDISTTRIHLSRKRILPLHAPHFFLRSQQVSFPILMQLLISAHQRK